MVIYNSNTKHAKKFILYDISVIEQYIIISNKVIAIDTTNICVKIRKVSLLSG